MSTSDSASQSTSTASDLFSMDSGGGRDSDGGLVDPMHSDVAAFDALMQPGDAVQVASGDTLSTIAAEHGVTLDELLSVNTHINNPHMIFPGQQINLPSGVGAAGDQAVAAHTVRPGDTMSRIAADNNMTLGALIDANPQIRNPNLINPGEVINLSSAPSQPPAVNPNQPVSGGEQPRQVVDGEFDYNMIVGVQGNANVTPQFIAEVEAMAQRLDTKPEYLLATMSFETGGSFSPAARNSVSGATGLIQFIPPTARGLGTSTAELANMSAFGQLRFVEAYFDQYAGKLGTLEGVYSSVLSGRATPNPDDTLHNFEGNHPNYRQNAGLDFNRDGRITSGEATTAVASRMYGGVLEVQHALVDAGAVADSQRVNFADGNFGPATARAVASFQRSQGLPATGYLDDATGRALFGSAPLDSTQNVTTPDADGGLALSQTLHERATPARQTITSPVIGDFILTEGFMARGGPHSSKSATQAVFSDNPNRAEPIAAGVYNLGIDYVTTNGRIDSWFSGEVIDIIHSNTGYGNRLIMRSDQTFNLDGRDYPVYAHYAHADSFNVSEGQRIAAGQDIGDQGSTGHSTGDHVDFLTWIQLDNGARVYISPNLLTTTGQ